ncbi:TRAP transporter substrate-binding protein [soil metagenome]
MNMQRKGFLNRSLALAGAALAMLAGPMAHAQTRLAVSQWVPPTHPVAEVMTAWAQQVDKATAGRVKLQNLPQAVTNPPGHFNAVRDGLADLAFTVIGYTPGRFQLSEIVEMPLMADSAELNSGAFWRLAQQQPAVMAEYKDVKVLALFTHGPGTVFNTRQEITSLADLQKLKFRVGGGVVNEVGKLMNANVTIKPATESYELLSNGVMDGVWLPVESVATYKLEKLVRYITTFPGGLYSSSFIVMMNKKKWESLGKEDQAAIDGIAGESFSRALGKAFDQRDEEGRKLALASGIKITAAPPALVKEVESRIAPLEKRWVDLAASRGVANAEQVIKAYRADARKAP